MTRYASIEPDAHLLRIVDKSIFDAVVDAGLNDDGTDHSMVDKHTGIVFNQYDMYVPPEQQDYFAINGRLYAGNALIYGVDDRGNTVDIVETDRLTPIFLHGREEVERAIQDGLIARPQLRVNGELIWKWPDQPAPGVMP